MPRKNKDGSRDYTYDKEYQSTKKQKKRRAGRNRSRKLMEAAGKVFRGDGKDVDHPNHDPDNKKASLKVMSASRNRSKK